jgi:DNA-binding LacI/PurR family transcriptional regulator
MSARISLRQLAEQAGYSHTTIRLALENSPRIARATAEKIQELARRKGYLVNPYLSAWMSTVRQARTSNDLATIAYIDLSAGPQPLVDLSFAGGAARARDLGYKLEMLRPGIDGLTLSRVDRVLKNTNIRGVILGPKRYFGGHISLSWNRLAAVAIGYSLLRPKLHCVAHHQYSGMQLALRQAGKMGCRRIALSESPEMDRRTNGHYAAAYLHFQRFLPASARVPIFYPLDDSATKFRSWFRRYQPDCVLSFSTGQKDWIENEKGARLILLDHSTAVGAEACAGVDQHHQEIGREAVNSLAADLALNQMGIPRRRRIMLVEGSWVPSGSGARA